MNNSEKEYNVASNRVSEIVDKGSNVAMAWLDVDPDGKLRKEEAKRELKAQDAVTETGVREVRQVGIDSQLEKIDRILDPRERARALIQYQALQNAASDHKRRNF